MSAGIDLENELTESMADRELVTSRLLNAPRELVFRAFTEADHLARWWGPKGFTNTFHEFDPRLGGVWRFVMHGPNGKDYQNKSIFTEIESPSRIVLQHVSGPLFQLSLSLGEEEGKTRLTWSMLFETAEECAKVKTYAGDANEQNLDRLETELRNMNYA
jgi:uncharacterized protein YndB with AHSA1/START domain